MKLADQDSGLTLAPNWFLAKLKRLEPNEIKSKVLAGKKYEQVILYFLNSLPARGDFFCLLIMSDLTWIQTV